ncbi:transcriptional regulator, AraC family [Rhodopirellula maiorica SM1]|uniref:Transcriptional regulator, AraC family n=1 Tax=Rhodopirellula maiorica SM1 TaxID=1265738 RepID=M5R910_9BACT|nr:helix-turn-helix domain-containing protein [Rhodopirellula maiorica]EMI15541.1 transcriptional regulator, AraC family [Rhodopirellula maiorica SM1]
METEELNEQAFEDYYHYLPVNDAAMLWGIYVTGVGRGGVLPQAEYPAKGHPGLYQFTWARGRVLPEFQVVLISDGQGVFESQQTGEVAIEAGHALLLFPGVWHRYRPLQQVGWQEHWISFNGVMTHRLQELDLIRPNRAVGRVKGYKTLADRFDDLIQRVKTSLNQNSVLLSMQAMALIGSVIEAMATPGQIPGGNRTVREKDISDPLVADTLNLIWTHSDRAFSVKAFADRLSVSRRVLERRFAAELGHSILEEMVTCRLSRAKRLLRETDLGVKEVAYIAGFPSEERMRVTFKATEYMSPSQYRTGVLDQQPKPG